MSEDSKNQAESFLERGLILPKHIAFIMDGNRRWGEKNKQNIFQSYWQGFKTFHNIMDFCKFISVKHITVFAFSTENSKRSINETKLLFQLVIFACKKYKNKLIENKCRIKFIGDSNLLSASLKKSIKELEELTASYDDFHLNIAFNYSGRWDILQAAKQLALTAQEKPEVLETLTEQSFHQFLSLADQVYPEILIRTGCNSRLSNFLLWELAYTELFFLDTLWPDFSPNDLINIIERYNHIQRNFGT